MLIITVSGGKGEGKTAIARLIHNELQQARIPVHNTDNDSPYNYIQKICAVRDRLTERGDFIVIKVETTDLIKPVAVDAKTMAELKEDPYAHLTEGQQEAIREAASDQILCGINQDWEYAREFIEHYVASKPITEVLPHIASDPDELNFVLEFDPKTGKPWDEEE